MPECRWKREREWSASAHSRYSATMAATRAPKRESTAEWSRTERGRARDGMVWDGTGGTGERTGWQ